MSGTGGGLRVEVLGPLRVTGPEEAVPERASHRRLLSILALYANHTVETDTLIERNWNGAPPAGAKATLHVHVSALRRLLPERLIVTEPRGYRLDLSGHVRDADELTALADEASRAAAESDWPSALDACSAALALWRGTPYAALEDDDFARAEIARLEELRLMLLELRAEALMAIGRERDALPELERLVVEHPLRERLWELLMTARYRSGRHAEALEAYREAYAALAEIGLEPSAGLRELERRILVQDERLGGSPRHNLPVELTGFVGRERELAEAGRLLAEHRLVTLTGVGGAGKTRLALHVAASTLGAYADGCWLAELAKLQDPGLVPLEVANALGLQTRAGDAAGAVASAVARDTTLILLDNCEHVLGAAASLARALLEAGPGVTVLATSREPLHVPGEVVYDVPPMSFPGERPVAPATLRAFDSVRLFEERAALARPSFELEGDNADAVARICRRLDGIPLAIELAAGRAGSLSPESIADHLDDRFRILTGGPSTAPERHRTLEAALDWSLDLLDAKERSLFARLGVFHGGFDLAAVAEVCADDSVVPASVTAVLSSLVQKSLVSVYEADAARRHRLLETVRHYALERLEASGDAHATRERHMHWCVRFATDAAARVHGPGRWELHDHIDAESANLQAALDWALDNGHEPAAAELARVLAWHGFDRRRLQPCIPQLRAALEGHSSLETEAECRALLITALYLGGDEDAACEELERANEAADRLDPSPAKVWALTACARVHLLAVNLDSAAAIPLCRQALAEAEASGDRFALVYARRALGRALVWTGEADQGVEQHEAALGVALAIGDPATTLQTYRSFFDLLYLHPTARRSEPKRLADELLAAFPPDNPRWGERVSAEGWLPYVFCQSGEWKRAEELLELLGRRHLEGWDRVGYLVTHCTLRRMQGRLDDAHAGLAELRQHGVPPGWYHDYYPLLAEIAADEGRLGDVRGVAAAYLAADVVPAEEATKLAVLAPLARAEVDAALAATDGGRDDHVRRATAAVERARDILSRFPPQTGGSLQIETPATQLALAEAELSRAVDPDPALWNEAAARADYAYFRMYARWRLAESLLDTGRPTEAEAELRGAHRDAAAIGAGRLRLELEATAARAGIEPVGERA
ncbi:MAG: BTAD domain-containing putative transcriptional regulator [Gaiellaceae bacterium]